MTHRPNEPTSAPNSDDPHARHRLLAIGRPQGFGDVAGERYVIDRGDTTVAVTAEAARIWLAIRGAPLRGHGLDEEADAETCARLVEQGLVLDSDLEPAPPGPASMAGWRLLPLWALSADEDDPELLVAGSGRTTKHPPATVTREIAAVLTLGYFCADIEAALALAHDHEEIADIASARRRLHDELPRLLAHDLAYLVRADRTSRAAPVPEGAATRFVGADDVHLGLLPLGLPVGTSRAGLPSALRVGGFIEDLSVWEGAMWHTAPLLSPWELAAEAPRGALESAVARYGVPEPERVLRSLEARELVVALRGSHAYDALHRIRCLPLLTGLRAVDAGVGSARPGPLLELDRSLDGRTLETLDIVERALWGRPPAAAPTLAHLIELSLPVAHAHDIGAVAHLIGVLRGLRCIGAVYFDEIAPEAAA